MQIFEIFRMWETFTAFLYFCLFAFWNFFLLFTLFRDEIFFSQFVFLWRKIEGKIMNFHLQTRSMKIDVSSDGKCICASCEFNLERNFEYFQVDFKGLHLVSLKDFFLWNWTWLINSRNLKKYLSELVFDSLQQNREDG